MQAELETERTKHAEVATSLAAAEAGLESEREGRAQAEESLGILQEELAAEQRQRSELEGLFAAERQEAEALLAEVRESLEAALASAREEGEARRRRVEALEARLEEEQRSFAELSATVQAHEADLRLAREARGHRGPARRDPGA
ncbi:hypothetical protein ACN28S_36880 [Cystobacter fuscus]